MRIDSISFLVGVEQCSTLTVIRQEELETLEEDAIASEEVKREIIAQENLTKAIETLTEVIQKQNN